MDYKILFSKTKELTLLLAEDYAPFRDDMVEMLEDLFKTVVVAEDGREALALYETYYEENNKNFDLVITDIQMPFMNGVDLSEAIQQLNADQHIIVLSAHTDSEYLLKLINLGISQFITKPIDYDVFLNTLCTVSKKISTNSSQAEDVTLVDLGEDHIWDVENLILLKGNILVELTRHELLLLQLMLKKKDQVCTNEDIMNEFYIHDIDILETSIRNMVFKVRKKLPSNAISSLYGLGYKLMPSSY